MVILQRIDNLVKCVIIQTGEENKYGNCSTNEKEAALCK